MNFSVRVTDERVADVRCDADYLAVDLMDGRTISVPLAWYPRLAAGTPAQRANWEVAGAGFGIHWPDLDEDISVENLLATDDLMVTRTAPTTIDTHTISVERSRRYEEIFGKDEPPTE